MAGILLKNFKYTLGLRFVHKLYTPSNKSLEKYRISLLRRESQEKAIEFMTKHFRDDPLTVALGADTSDDFPRLLDFVWSDDVQQGFTMQAISETGEMVGLAINAATNERTNTEKMNTFAENCNCYNTKNLMDAWHQLSKLSVLVPFSSAPRGVFEISGVAVSNDHRGFGIAKRLIVQSTEMAKCHGFKTARIDCTNEYSAQAAQALGFQCIYEIPFEHFQGIKSVSEPHTRARVFAKPLDGFLM